MEKITKLADVLLSLADKLKPVSLFGLRLWIANIFWKSAMTKLDDWDSTLFLFEEVYAVPFLPTEVAAFMGTAGEIVGPILLAFGFGGRIGATILLGVTAVIELTYEHNDQHIIWALILLTLMLHGPGKISIDNFISRKFLPHRNGL